MDQAIGLDWVICEDGIVAKSEKDNPTIDPTLWFDLKPSSYFFNRAKFFYQLKSPLSIWLSYFQGESPFWRPPPAR
jgi:hypothetical protein